MSTIIRMPVRDYVAELEAAYKRGDGYIMGATGQNPKKWGVTAWWFSQYTSASQHAKALYWREHAARVWDCNGMPEGIYKDFSGVDINTKARYNYANWCGIKGSGTIPAKYRVPGAAVFWGDTASTIHHVATLYKPVDSANPSGDWYIIEARGVMYGVVRTKLSARKPNYWGIMDKYFDYSAVLSPVATADDNTAVVPILGSRTLRNGSEGDDVKQLQTYLITLGYDLGKWGADGEFGDCTEIAVREFQTKLDLKVDGIAGSVTIEALEKEMAAYIAAQEQVAAADQSKKVQIVDGQCYIRAEPDKTSKSFGIAKKNSVWEYGGDTADNGWLSIMKDGEKRWVSNMYGRMVVA